MIPAEMVNRFRQALTKVTGLATQELNSLWYSIRGMSADEIRDFLLLSLPTLTSKYGDIAAIAAAEFYEEIRAYQIGGSYTAQYASTVPTKQVESAVRYAAGSLYSGAPEETLSYLKGITDKYVKQAARDTISQNAVSDIVDVRFARVPSGAKTCAWCLMLASRGFVYASAKTAGELGQYHKACDCQIVPEFSKNPSIEGYDPEEYYQMYVKARGEARSGEQEDITAAIRRLFPDRVTDGVIQQP